jgi:hypothetical protein
MKREELTEERRQNLKSFERGLPEPLTDEQIEEYNQLCDEFNTFENKLQISPFKYADFLQKVHKLLTNLSDYTKPEDEIVFSDEQFLKRLYIRDLKWYLDDLSKEIKNIEAQFEKEIHPNS